MQCIKLLWIDNLSMYENLFVDCLLYPPLILDFDEIITISEKSIQQVKRPSWYIFYMLKNLNFFQILQHTVVMQRARERRGKCRQQWALYSTATTCCSLLRALCGLHFTENSPKSGGTEFHHDKYQLQSITAVSSCQIHPLYQNAPVSPTGQPGRPSYKT